MHRLVVLKVNVLQVVAPLSRTGSLEGFTVRNFPMLLAQDGVPIVWNMHRLSLDRSPIFDARKAGDVDWIRSHVSLALSDRERNQNISSTSPVLSQVKETLHGIFTSASGLNAKRIFGFKAPSCGIYTIVFLNHLRLDLASNTLVADVCVLPLTLQRLEIFGEILSRICHAQMVVINTSEGEALAWKQLLPACVERCRSWCHMQNCEYIHEDNIPLSVELKE
jgi:hypothetical protein